MKEKAQQYVSWIGENPELVTATTLFFKVNNVYEHYKESPQANKYIVFPEGIVQDNKVLISELAELVGELAKPYATLIRKAKGLPTEEVDSPFFYRLCDAFFEAKLQVPEYCHPHEIFSGEIYGQFSLPVIPKDSTLSERLRLALSVAYAQAVLKDVEESKKSYVFEYTPEQRRVEPSVRWTDLVERDVLTPAEMRSMGRNIQQLEVKVMKAIDREEISPIDPFAYGHCLKNTPRGLSDLITLCHKLGIPFAFGERAKRLGRKTLEDVTLFD